MIDSRIEIYRSDTRRYDELLDSSGEVRPQWRPLIDALASGGADAVRRAVELARRLIVENGVTYNVYADPQGRDRPWVLDPLPILLTAAEWREIELGVAQRAQLFDAMLADLYGPQRLLADGTVPAELPFGHPNFLWPCHGITPAGGNWLHVHAVDISRSADGRWWALADRTQTPSGPGYALENRQIVSRVFPDLLGDLGVRALGGFFAALRENLLRHAPDTEAALAVVLTPGAFNETYFEHAYLARQLGLPLVEGHDLTVRGDTVYLKTLGGLRRVHAILRRLDDDFCDPVELRADSALGVPGLIGVVRAGRVVLANGLGSGVLESAAWMGFMPAASERLLGEKLRLPSVATWWCGERLALDYVLENLDRLVIKPAYPNQKLGVLFGRDLDPQARADLARRLQAQPHAYVAQERLAFSQAPVWRSGSAGAQGFSAHALGIRVYAIATASGYRVMPGGLARIASDAADIVSMQRGGGSKDVWVLAPDRRAIDETQPASAAPPATVRHDDLPSRMAENLFWLGRYSERCEDKARLLRATLRVRPNAQLWPQVLETCGHFVAPSLFDDVNPSGLTADLQRLGLCAAQARSRLSAENWRAIDVLQREFQDAAHAKRDPRETLDALLLSLAGLAGFALDDMTQDDGWRLMMIGRRLERLRFLAELLAHRLRSGETPAPGELEWLLDIGDSTITYRTRYLAAPRLGPTIDLLVFDQTNPRALAFQWHDIEHSLVRVAVSLGGAPDDTLDEAVALVEEMQLSGIEGDSTRAMRARQSLAEHLQSLSAAAGRLSDRLSLKHFTLIDTEIRTVAA
ncbi:MAG TPA: circularly permuted type 2 ATP-grasp protein [Steroidobacteraceae bacterium]|nr:circularly permuted type 2 ATP-grasp protein [Steroidobacteraceae bacterium]